MWAKSLTLLLLTSLATHCIPTCCRVFASPARVLQAFTYLPLFFIAQPVECLLECSKNVELLCRRAQLEGRRTRCKFRLPRACTAHSPLPTSVLHLQYSPHTHTLTAIHRLICKSSSREGGGGAGWWVGDAVKSHNIDSALFVRM